MEISNVIVRLYRDYAGKGPSSCKAYWADEDILLVVMRGGFTVAEQRLHEGGHGDVVQQAWHKLQDTLKVLMTGAIMELTGGGVVAFMTTIHQKPDFMAQLFILTPEDPRAPGQVGQIKLTERTEQRRS